MSGGTALLTCAPCVKGGDVSLHVHPSPYYITGSLVGLIHHGDPVITRNDRSTKPLRLDIASLAQGAFIAEDRNWKKTWFDSWETGSISTLILVRRSNLYTKVRDLVSLVVTPGIIAL
ncbi:hypothetical protein BDN71DRAFT_1436914 [Pleurotus eryngii]|uniref:Uncharacterized protein n=1 Tax=Pleurotus eryngii TaxID=5323 RepID=A0A9P5ZH66_PLEER|nr:hypothetical protein BDN71DRAFT_1436914 [Pleurotus eryngii]